MPKASSSGTAVRDEDQGSSSPPPSIAASLDSVVNFRDLGTASDLIANERVYRTANPTACSTPDFESLLAANVHTLIDLRAPEEIEETLVPDAGLVAGVEVVTHRRAGMFSSSMATDTAANPGEPQSERALTMHRIAPLDRNRFYRGLLWRLPTLMVAKAVISMVCDPTGGRAMMMRAVNDGGLPLLYSILLDTAGPEFAAVLDVMLTSLEADMPVVFFCKAGKDRTGLVAMLVLMLCGVKDVEIIDDYHISDQHRSLALGGVEKDDTDAVGLDRDKFSAAPRAAIESALQHVRGKHGGIASYLTSIKFDAAKQQRLRAVLLA